MKRESLCAHAYFDKMRAISELSKYAHNILESRVSRQLVQTKPALKLSLPNARTYPFSSFSESENDSMFSALIFYEL